MHGLLRDATRRLLRRRIALVGLVIVGAFFVMGLLAPVLAPYDPLAVNPALRLAPPSRENPFGRDELGRDILSRILYGARLSLLIGFVSVGVGFFIGVPWGIVSGYRGDSGPHHPAGDRRPACVPHDSPGDPGRHRDRAGAVERDDRRGSGLRPGVHAGCAEPCPVGA